MTLIHFVCKAISELFSSRTRSSAWQLEKSWKIVCGSAPARTWTWI